MAALWEDAFSQALCDACKSHKPEGLCHHILQFCLHILCRSCDAGAVGDEKHLVFECAQLAPLRAKYADLFSDKDHTMRFFFCAAGPSEGVSLCHRLLKLDGQIVIAAV